MQRVDVQRHRVYEILGLLHWVYTYSTLSDTYGISQEICTDNGLARGYDLCPLIKGWRSNRGGTCIQLIPLPTRICRSHMIHPYGQFYRPHVIRNQPIPLTLDSLA